MLSASNCICISYFDLIFFSGLRETAQWLSKVNEKGEIFELKVEPVHDTAGDKECLCTCSDCATDDTGYGTDPDVVNNFSKLDDDEFPEKDIICGVDGIGDLLKVGKTDSVELDCASVNLQSIEEDIDSLFASVSSKSQFDTLRSESFDLGCNIEELFVGGFSGMNNVPTDSTAKKKSLTMTNPESSSKVVRNDTTSKLHHELLTAKLSDSNCSCNLKETGGLEGSLLSTEKTFVLKLKYRSSDVATSTVELCEQLLGIVPGHFSSTSENRNRRRDKRIKIRGLIPTGVSAKQPEIKLGK